MTETREQLRRLKNTIMGASHRLSLIARSGETSAEVAASLNRVVAELNASVQRLERLVASVSGESEEGDHQRGA